MGEVKSVKVDNWGVFFLQKLQNFFNKTDYCDLTLQFRDNSQLKVHRLVLSACTDYFNVLEQTCEIIDDALIMPNEFQADVVVPIVNFMYTGTLEFELKMYGKLLRTAKEMNMTVLLKLLEAHRRTMENVNRQQRPPSPKGIRRSRGISQISPQRNISVAQQSRSSPQTPQQQQQVRRTAIGSNSGSLLRTSGGTATQQIKQEQSTSPFEQLRKGYNNNKRPANTTILSPPAKKPNLEDVKEFAEQQRMRKQIAAEYGTDDHEYEGMLDDDIHADDDDDDLATTATPNASHASTSTKPSSAQTSQTTQVEHGSATIFFKHETADQPPTIIVKDSSSAKLNHAKIIAEVLRQYPHLVKGQKNIKLKIMPNSPAGGPQKVIKKEADENAANNASSSAPKKLQISSKVVSTSPAQTQTVQKAPLRESTTHKGPSTSTQAITSTTSASKVNTGSPNTQVPVQPQKRRIDSRTMHALIALGAENTEGPWLCLRCGVNGRPISIPSYRGFRRHLINTHKETIDPALCEYCGWRSTSDRELHLHMQVEHNIKSSQYDFFECSICSELCLNEEHLGTHMNEAHPEESDHKQQCIYCNQMFSKELDLYTHLKSYHKSQALDDGIIDDTDTEEYLGSQDEEEQSEQRQPINPKRESKVKILSDISLPVTSPLIKTANTDEAITTASTATTSDSEVKFVGADGNEVQLTEEQRKEILAQLSQQENQGDVSGGVLMVLNEPTEIVEHEQHGTRADMADVKSACGTTDDELHDDASSMAEEYDDSQIYNELNSQSGGASDGKKSENANLDESKESLENLEWAENLISEHEMQSDEASTANKSIEKPQNVKLTDKLKELTCDWSEDENDDELTSEAVKPVKTGKLIDNQNSIADDTHTEIGSKQAAHNDNKVDDKIEVDEEEQDDIDLAMQSLHKEDEEEKVSHEIGTKSDSVQDIKGIYSAAAQKESAVLSAQLESVDEVAPKACVEPTAKIDDKVVDDVVIKTESIGVSEEEFIRLSPEKKTRSNTSDESHAITEQEEKIGVATAAGEETVSQLETEEMKRTLLDELIAEADKAKNDNNESVDDVDAEQQQAVLSEALAIVGEKSIDDNKDKVEDANLVEDFEETATKIIVDDVKKEKETECATIENKETLQKDAKFDVASGEKVELKPPTSSSSSSANASAVAERAAVSSGSESASKVKSIINDWADDEEDDDATSAVDTAPSSAAAIDDKMNEDEL